MTKSKMGTQREFEEWFEAEMTVRDEEPLTWHEEEPAGYSPPRAQAAWRGWQAARSPEWITARAEKATIEIARNIGVNGVIYLGLHGKKVIATIIRVFGGE